jgi:hypothetical protein
MWTTWKETSIMAKMKAAVFVEPGRIVLDEKPIPDVGPLDALIRIKARGVELYPPVRRRRTSLRRQ